MFKFRIVKAETLNKLQSDLAEQQRVTGVLKLRLDNLADQAERNNKATRQQLSVLAKPTPCPLLTATPKHVIDPMGAWESKQLVLKQRLKYIRSCIRFTLGRDHTLHHAYRLEERELVEQIYIHGTRKPVIVQLLPPKETAVIVYHKKYGTKGLLKGNHITILSKGNKLDVGDVILNATPAIVYKFWNIAPEMVEVSVRV